MKKGVKELRKFKVQILPKSQIFENYVAKMYKMLNFSIVRGLKI